MNLWKKYHQQDDGKDFYQSRVIGVVHKSLHSCIDSHFFVPARCGRKENLCNHKAQRWTEPFPQHQRDNKCTKRECSKILSDTFQQQLAVQQEASEITRQNVAGPSAGPSSNLNRPSLLQNQFISLAQSHRNCTRHIQIGTMIIYHGSYEEPSPPTRKRRRIIESDNSD